MTVRSLLSPLLLLLASCVPQATARTDEAGIAPLPATLIRWSGTPVEAIYQAPTRNEIVEQTAVGDPAEPFQFADGQADLRGNSLDCLTAAIYYEARSETVDGQRAVAQVVLNRARHPAFPNSVCGVVYQGSALKTGCQFTFTCDGSMAALPRGRAWVQSQQLANAVMMGYTRPVTQHATHYHTTAVNPVWSASLVETTQIGSHIFYRLPNAADVPIEPTVVATRRANLQS